MSDSQQGRAESSGDKEPPDSKTAVKEEIERSINDLLSDNSTSRADTISKLEKYGEDAVSLLVNTLLKKSDISDTREPVTTALEEIGKPSVNILIHALGKIGEVKNARDVYLIEAITETLWHIQDRRAATALAEQVGKLNKAVKERPDESLKDLCVAAKARLHFMLSEMGVKDELEDLLAMLGDGRKRVREGVVEALEKIGDKRALVALIRLHEGERTISDWNARLIKNTVREIVKRGKVAIDDEVFTGLEGQEKETLEKIYPRHKAVNGHGSNGNGHHQGNGAAD